jgi:cellulose synthase/poly-beta-1,6-N-acetylglucosamine synthase-like glycosyltransferase
MGHLSENENQEVEALSGAFLMIKKEVLDKTGGFDERFFMYAEDIDLSFRIKQAGYQNHYFSETTILHFKGESTRKDARYVQLFYQAMIQFVHKHYRGFSSVLLALLLHSIAGVKTLFSFLVLPSGKNQQPSLNTSLIFTPKGDSDSIKEVSSYVSLGERAENILYCTGSRFSNIQMIEEIQKQTRKKRVFIHACNSQSIVGSGSKDRQGIILSGIVH